MPSKILRDDEGNEYEINDFSFSPAGLSYSWIKKIPKPEPTLEEKIVALKYNADSPIIAVAKLIIAEVGKVYGLKAGGKDGEWRV